MGIIAAGLVTGATSSAVQGAVVSGNFVGNENTTLAAGDLAGVVSAGNWNNLARESGQGNPPNASIALSDSSGAASGVSISYAYFNEWYRTDVDPNANANSKLFKGVASDADGVADTLTFNNVAAGSYDLYLYVMSAEYRSGNAGAGESGFFSDYAAGGTTYRIHNQARDQWTNGGPAQYQFDRATNTVNSDASRDIGNYVLFEGLTPDDLGSLSFSIRSANVDGTKRGSIQGFQLVSAAVPEPTAIGALALPAIAGLLARRRKSRQRA
jgi:hypothetical protein